jgi:hypothetical protein
MSPISIPDPSFQVPVPNLDSGEGQADYIIHGASIVSSDEDDEQHGNQFAKL